MGAVSEVSVVALEDVEPIPLPGGSWSRMLVTAATRGRQPQLAGLLRVHPRHRADPGAPTRPRRSRTWSRAAASCAWTTGPCAFRAGDALHIPAGVWHAVANTGDDDVVMVFGFPHPEYPPTERR